MGIKKINDHNHLHDNDQTGGRNNNSKNALT
jgi:hypothetical protein